MLAGVQQGSVGAGGAGMEVAFKKEHREVCHLFRDPYGSNAKNWQIGVSKANLQVFVLSWRTEPEQLTAVCLHVFTWKKPLRTFNPFLIASTTDVCRRALRKTMGHEQERFSEAGENPRNSRNLFCWIRHTNHGRKAQQVQATEEFSGNPSMSLNPYASPPLPIQWPAREQSWLPTQLTSRVSEKVMAMRQPPISAYTTRCSHRNSGKRLLSRQLHLNHPSELWLHDFSLTSTWKSYNIKEQNTST